MSKINITDEMVRRALTVTVAGHMASAEAGKTVNDYLSWHAVRAALDAALNPPPEPEIPVTEEMMRAGADAIGDAMMIETLGSQAARIYRAMRKLEPKPDTMREALKKSYELSNLAHGRKPRYT